MMIRRLFAALLILTCLLIVSCGSQTQAQPTYTKSGKVRDTIHQVENRGNGAVIIWVTHSDDGYCFPDPAKVDQVDDLIEKHNGEVIINYKSQLHPGETNPLDPKQLCQRTEQSMTVYLGVSIKAVPSR